MLCFSKNELQDMHVCSVILKDISSGSTLFAKVIIRESYMFVYVERSRNL